MCSSDLLALDLPSSVIVLNGCGDAGASTLGSCIAQAGDAHIYVGTTAWVAQIADHGAPSEAVYTLAMPHGAGVIRIGAMLSGGEAVNWLKGLLNTEIDVLDAALAARATLEARSNSETCAPKRSNLLFLPYLRGERCPFQDADVRGAFFGLTPETSDLDLFEAVLDGLAHALAANLAALSPPIGPLRMTGGGATSRHLPQKIADCTGMPVMIVDRPLAATAAGGFLIAARSLGLVIKDPHPGISILPDPAMFAYAKRRAHLYAQATTFARSLGNLAEE